MNNRSNNSGDIEGSSPVSFYQMIIWMLLTAASVALLVILPEISLPFTNNNNSSPSHSNSPAISPEPVPANNIFPEYDPDIYPTISPQKTGSIDAIDDQPGITVLSRSDGFISSDTRDAPVAAGADAANGFAISLGEARAYSNLSERFGRIAKMNEVIFRSLEPRAIFVETDNGLRARLVAGPFTTLDQANKICGALHLPKGISCQTQAFDGDLIARQ